MAAPAGERNRFGRLNPDGPSTPPSIPAWRRARLPTSTSWWCSRMGRSWSAAFHGRRRWDGDDHAQPHGPAQCRRLARRAFNPGALQRGFCSLVYAMALQPDGKIVVGGRFHDLGGGTGATARTNRRLNADGSVDAGFNPGANDFVIPRRPAGWENSGRRAFPTMGGGGTGVTDRNGSAASTPTARSTPASIRAPTTAIFSGWRCSRTEESSSAAPLQVSAAATGTTRSQLSGGSTPTVRVDADFDPGANGTSTTTSSPCDPARWPDPRRRHFTALGGGIGGTPRSYHRTAQRRRLARRRLQSRRERDVFTLAVQADGKILVGGISRARRGPARPLQQSGGSTPTARSTPTSIRAERHVFALAMQADGKILVGGIFDMAAATGRRTPTRAPQRRRLGRRQLQSRRGPTARQRDRGAGGWQDPGRRRVHVARRRHRAWSFAQPDRAAQRRRLGRRSFNPGAPAASGVGLMLPCSRRQDPGRRRLHGSAAAPAQRRAVTSGASTPTARSTALQSGRERLRLPSRCSRTARSWSAATSRARRRHRHDDAQPHRPAQRRRLARRDLRSRRESTSLRWRCRRTGRSSSAATSPRLAAAPAPTPRSKIGRINPDGSIDANVRSGREQHVFSDRARGRRQGAGRRLLHDARRRRHRHDGAQPHRPAVEYRRGAPAR